MNYIELFSCSGGAALGFRRAGIEFDIVIDADPDACDSYGQNIGHRPIRMDVRDFVRLAVSGLMYAGTARHTDHGAHFIFADPPCTPWSRAGKRLGLDDERDMLSETIEVVDLLRPTCWMIANVPGLDDSNHWSSVVQPVIGGFAMQAGYCVDYAKLDAADYGVPQRRIRPFWFGHPRGTPCIRWPAPTHGDPSSIGHAALGDHRKPWVTCREALSHLSADDLGRPVRLRYRAATATTEAKRKRAGKRSRASEPDRPAGVVTSRPNQGDGSVLALRHPSSEMDSPAKVVPSSMPGNGGATLLLNSKHPVSDIDEPARTVRSSDGGGSKRVLARDQALLEWPWGRPSTTIQSDERLGSPGHHDPNARGYSGQHGPDAVVLSERGAALLQGFPDGWHFAGKTKKARWGQIGMAMPPPLMHAVATSIVDWMRRHREQAI